MLNFFSINYLRERWSGVGFKRHVKNLGWMFFARIGNMFIALLATSYIARNLGAQNYGQLSYAISYVSLFSFFASFGIDQVLSRDLIRFPDKRNLYMGSALVLRITTSCIAIFITIISATLIPSSDASLLLILIISLSLLFNSSLLFTYEFQAIAKYKYPSILSMLIVLILNILKIGVMMHGKGIIYLALIILLEPILYTIGLIFLYNKYLGSIFKLSFDSKIAMNIAKQSFPLIFTSAFIAVYARIDQVMIKYALGNFEVGLYDAAVRLSELWIFIPHTITAGLFSTIVNAKSISEQLYRNRIRKLFYLLITVSAMTALITTVLAKPIILLVFGFGFIGAISVLQVYIWSNIGTAINLLIHQILLTENLTYISSIITFIGMITNILLNIFFIPKMGMVGAALASLISYLVPYLSLYFFKKTKHSVVRNMFLSEKYNK